MKDRPAYGSERLDDYLSKLGLPPAMADRPPDRTPRIETLLEEFHSQRVSRNFLPGLALAMLALVERVLAHQGVEHEDKGVDAYERQTQNPQGQHVNTLNVILPDGEMIRLRPLYNAVQHVIVHELRRYDYPNMPGHATQAWRQHQDLLDGLFAVTPGERRAVADEVWSTVTALHHCRAGQSAAVCVDTPGFSQHSATRAGGRCSAGARVCVLPR